MSLPTMIKLGTIIKPYGKVIAIGLLQGERYYWLYDGWTVSMMPACVLEGEA